LAKAPFVSRGWSLALLPALLLALWNLRAPLHGSHLFRQAHIAANIETYLRDGISLHPRTYNYDVPLALYDCPLYQVAVALTCRLLNGDPLVTARVLSGLSFILALAVLSRLMSAAGVARPQRALALVFFANASLNLFYVQTPLVDTLAETASLVSLLAFTSWNETAEAPWWCLMVLSGVAAALIKNPVELSSLVAAVWSRARTRAWRGLVSGGMLVYVASLGAAVLGFKLYANATNGATGLITPWEEGQYFGSASQRFDPDAWAPIVRTLGLLVLNPVTLVLASGGALTWLLRSKSRRRAVFGGLFVGAIASVLVFLNRYRVHNYYLLPLVFPFAFFAAHGVQQCRVLGRAWRRGGRKGGTAFSAAVVVLSLAATAFFSWRGYDELATVDPTKQARGEWVQKRSSPDDFVIWVVGGDDDNWNPAFLYFAKRDGYNLNRSHLERATLRALYERFAGRGRVLLFSSDRTEDEQIESLGAHPVAADKARRLYLVEPSWLASTAVSVPLTR
jgi:hypothetical protein